MFIGLRGELDVHVFELGCGLGDWVSVLHHALEMHSNCLAHPPANQAFCLARCDTSGKIRHIRAEACLRLLDHVSVSHYLFFFHSCNSRFVSFACFSIDRSVPSAMSSPGSPTTVTFPGFTG